MNKKVVSWTQLKKEISRLRKKRKKIVFTNGCFDLIHVGHLKVLEACRKKGDILILGLNSDTSVRRLKGRKRPIINQKDRADLLAGFEAVHYVTVFNADTPQNLIKRIKPDVLVKGGDWKSNQIVGASDAKKVVRVPLVRGRSTSKLIQLIAKRYGRKN